MQIYSEDDFPYREKIAEGSLVSALEWVRDNIPANDNTLCGAKALLHMWLLSRTGRKRERETVALFDTNSETVREVVDRYIASLEFTPQHKASAVLSFADPDDVLMFKLRFA